MVADMGGRGGFIYMTDIYTVMAVDIGREGRRGRRGGSIT